MRSAGEWQTECDRLLAAIDVAERRRASAFTAWWRAVRAGELQIAEPLRVRYLACRALSDQVEAEYLDALRNLQLRVVDPDAHLLDGGGSQGPTKEGEAHP